MDQLKDVVYVKPKRTGFITVLCVLTFIGSAYGIFSAVVAFGGADKFTTEAKRQMEKSEKEMEARKSEDKTGAKMLKDINVFFEAKKIKQNAIASMFCNAATFIGALLMFRMNRTGFWVYMAGTVAGVAAPLLIFGNNSLAGFLAYIPGFFGLVFIVMYAFNLKDMKLQPLYD